MTNHPQSAADAAGTTAEPTAIDPWMAAECQRIAALENVLRVAVEPPMIAVFTNTLYCTDPRDNVQHEIGRFRIEIPLAGGAIGWFNLDQRVGRFQAPHVGPDGCGCLGNMKEVFGDLLSQREFSIAATLAIAFINIIRKINRIIGIAVKAT